jgi:hypothetical protein
MLKFGASVAVASALTFVLTVGLVSDALAACNGREVTKVGRNGTIKVCLDGKYSTCVRDARDRLGWGEAGVRRCNGLRSAGRIR